MQNHATLIPGRVEPGVEEMIVPGLDIWHYFLFTNTTHLREFLPLHSAFFRESKEEKSRSQEPEFRIQKVRGKRKYRIQEEEGNKQ